MITATAKAKQYIQKMIESRDGTVGIRFGVIGAGCGGYSYIVEYVDEPHNEDIIYQQGEVKYYVDPKSDVLLDGVEVDYVSDLLSSGLSFSHPKAATCGCGESFTI